MASAPQPDPLGDVGAFAALGDAQRRRLYDYVVRQARPVDRNEAAAATELGRPLAAYHLDKLVDAGLLDTRFARPPGRTGPGAGRPAKHYLRPDRALKAETPARDYAFVAQLLAEVAEHAGPAPDDTARDLARAHGRRIGATVNSPADLEAELATRGYEPRRDPDGTLRLANCPFHLVAATHPDLVCGLNHAFLEGLLQAAGIADQHAELDPGADRCCVAIRPRAA